MMLFCQYLKSMSRYQFKQLFGASGWQRRYNAATFMRQQLMDHFPDATEEQLDYLENYYLPGDLKARIEEFVNYYNTERYHESLNNLTPEDVYTGRGQTVLNRQRRIKQETLAERRRLYYKQKAA